MKEKNEIDIVRFALIIFVSFVIFYQIINLQEQMKQEKSALCDKFNLKFQDDSGYGFCYSLGEGVATTFQIIKLNDKYYLERKQ